MSLYTLDKDTFITLFCVNKDKPQLKCNGQCKVAKMRADAEEKKAKDLLGFIEGQIFQLYTSPSTLHVSTVKSQIVYQPVFIAYINNYSFLFAPAKRKPPKFALA